MISKFWTVLCFLHAHRLHSLCAAFVPPLVSVIPGSPRVKATSLGQTESGGSSEEVWKSLSKKLEKSGSPDPSKKKENKSMAFLRKIGKVGGASNKNFVNAVGSDEGSTGKVPPARGNSMATFKKAAAAYIECTASGTIDDLTDSFPLTSSGTEWRGVSDRVMGGVSNGFIKRETDVRGRVANVLTGHVSLKNNGGFIQMVTDLVLDPSNTASVDASEYDGIELDVLFRDEAKGGNDGGNKPTKMSPRFNVHLRTPGTFQQSSFRHTCELMEENQWETVRIPFSSFEGYGPEASEIQLDYSSLRRIGIVAIGKEMDVYLALAGIRFYTVI